MVVNDGSNIALQLPIHARLVIVDHHLNYGPAAARNSGLQFCARAGAEMVLFTDAGCLPDRSWTETMLNKHRKVPGIYGGVTLALKPQHPNQSKSRMVADFHDFIGTLNGRFVGDGDRDSDALLYAPSCNLGMSVKVARAISPNLFLFDESFPTAAFEDIELCVRAKEDQQVAVRLASNAIVMHAFQESLLGLTKQYFRYGKSEAIMVGKHPKYPAAILKAFQREEEGGRRLPPGSMLQARQNNNTPGGFCSRTPVIARMGRLASRVPL